MGAVDNRPYMNGMFSISDIHPEYPAWSTRDLSTPETREQSMIQQTSPTDEAIPDVSLAAAEKVSGNAGGMTVSQNQTSVLIWALVIIILLVVFNF